MTLVRPSAYRGARRRREIGIRAALGANPRRVLTAIFARAGAQLGTGVLIGLGVAAALDHAMDGDPLNDKGIVLLPSVAALMMLIGLVAALGPARRGLAVQPTEARREDWTAWRAHHQAAKLEGYGRDSP